MKLVSVIIPCFNSEKYLEETIQSILNQTYTSVEIICVDNGSADGTIDLIKKLQLEFPQIRLEFENKSGASFARNKGLSVAKGDYIQFLDSDDIIIASKFETQVAAIDSNNLDWVVSDRAIMNHDLSEKIEQHTYHHFMSDPIGVGIAEVITSGNPLYKTAVVKKVGGYTAELEVGQDWDFHIKLILAKTSFGYIKGEFFQSRTVQGSLSSNWHKVSKVLCYLINGYKADFTQLDVHSKPNAVQKIQHAYYFSALVSKDIKEVKFCISELKYWSRTFSIAVSLGKKDRLLLALLGVSNTIYLRRIFSNKES